MFKLISCLIILVLSNVALAAISPDDEVFPENPEVTLSPASIVVGKLADPQPIPEQEKPVIAIAFEKKMPDGRTIKTYRLFHVDADFGVKLGYRYQKMILRGSVKLEPFAWAESDGTSSLRLLKSDLATSRIDQSTAVSVTAFEWNRRFRSEDERTHVVKFLDFAVAALNYSLSNNLLQASQSNSMQLLNLAFSSGVELPITIRGQTGLSTSFRWNVVKGRLYSMQDMVLLGEAFTEAEMVLRTHGIESSFGLRLGGNTPLLKPDVSPSSETPETAAIASTYLVLGNLSVSF